jgi:xanthine/uracil/vitamin C permease (AzgA family)
MPKISKYLSENLSAALSVFFALGYVLVIVPKFLESAGMGYGSAFFAVAFASALGCFCAR